MEHYQKAKQTIIDPAQALYGGHPLNDAQVEAFVEDLGGYSEDVLNRAFKQVRQECRMRPSLAHFVTAIREFTENTSTGVASAHQRQGVYYCHRNTSLADKVMRSPVGQLALQHGVGVSVWMLAWRDGKRPADRDVWQQKREWQEAIDRLARFPNRGPLYQRLEGFYHAFLDREAKLIERYVQKAA